MTIHKEGYKTIIYTGLLTALVVFLAQSFLAKNKILADSISAFFILIFILIVYFFRNPNRKILNLNENLIYAPADGKIVVIENTKTDEFIDEERTQISIFMSPLNVHVNRYPISGIIKYFKHHCGNYYVAWHPKSSCENERTTIVIENANKKTILMRQIAGAMARRIVTYSKENEKVTQGDDLGFIKFGSRVDLFLPKDVKINVYLNQKVKGNKTIIAEFI
jgi:phosphatidylserine decarboxylase